MMHFPKSVYGSLQFVLAAAAMLSGCVSNSDTLLPTTPGTDPVDTSNPSEDTEQPPVAICTVDPTGPVSSGTPVRYSSADSYDLYDGDLIATEWSILHAPDGNTAGLSTRTGTITQITPDVAGEYQIQLSMINELNLRHSVACPPLMVQDAPAESE